MVQTSQTLFSKATETDAFLEITLCKVLNVFYFGAKAKTRMCAEIWLFPDIKRSETKQVATLYLNLWEYGMEECVPQ